MAWKNYVHENASIFGVDPEYLFTLSSIESNDGKNTYNEASGATGRFQFMPQTWKLMRDKYPELGLTEDGINDDIQNTRATLQLTQEHKDAFRRLYDRDPSNAELFQMHFLGSPRGLRLEDAPDTYPLREMIGEKPFQRVLEQNPHIKPDWTAGDLRNWVETTYEEHQPMALKNSIQDNGYVGYAPGMAPKPTQKPTQQPMRRPTTRQPQEAPNATPRRSQGLRDQIAQQLGFGKQEDNYNPILEAIGLEVDNDALAAWGAAAASGNDFFDSMGRGAAAVSDWRQGRKQQQQQRQDMVMQMIQSGVDPQQAMMLASGNIDPTQLTDDDLRGLRGERMDPSEVNATAMDYMAVGLDPQTAQGVASGQIPVSSLPPEQVQAVRDLQTTKGRAQNAGMFYTEDGGLVGLTFDPNEGSYEQQPLEGLTRAEDGLMKGVNKIDVESYDNVIKSGEAAAGRIPRLSMMAETIENNPDLYMGVGGESVDFLRRVGDVMGIDYPEQADADLMRNLTMQEIMGFISQTKGAISEKEMAAFEKSSPGLGKSPEGNMKIIKYGLAVARRAREKARFFRNNIRDLGYAQTQELWEKKINMPENNLFQQIVGDTSREDVGRITADDIEIIQ